MKLPIQNVSLEAKLREFDLWITPSLQEIQDTKKFRDELEKVSNLIDKLGDATNQFESIESCSPIGIAATCVELIQNSIENLSAEEEKLDVAVSILDSFCSLLFIVSGKSDNNLKCQFPVYLSQNGHDTNFPQRRGQSTKYVNNPLGRTIKSDKLTKIIADALVLQSLNNSGDAIVEKAMWLLGEYVGAILKDQSSIEQFHALGKSFFLLKANSDGAEKALLAPIVIFKVRGSVSASGGHIPEDLLREMMELWGMEKDTDFNSDDVIIEDSEGRDTTKTRAYDFVLPYQVNEWSQKIFIQCQFYAGDSGSVSHKVVDQTKASRPDTLEKFPDARFMEYLDGAGYYSSLNTDLQHMLGMETTKEFIQVRSAHIKLRRELQDIGFLTPIEIEHAIFRSSNGKKDQVREILSADGYALEEIERVLKIATGRNLLHETSTHYKLIEDRETFAKRLFLLDLVVLIGQKLGNRDDIAGFVLVPGFGDMYGAPVVTISAELDNHAPNTEYSRDDFADGLTWLAKKKYVIMK